MILSMSNIQKAEDFEIFNYMLGGFGMSIVLDSQKISNNGITIYRGRGYGKSCNVEQGFITLKNLKKRVQHNTSSLVALLSVETGRDIFNGLDNVVVVELQSSWSRIGYQSCINWHIE
eukprot:286017_1